MSALSFRVGPASLCRLKAGEETKVLVKISTMYEASGTSNGSFYIRTNIK